MPAQHANDANFSKHVFDTSQPVLVDFFADWCGPCRAMSPVVDQVADQLDGQARVVKVNVDQAPDTAKRYGIQSIPAFVVFRDGEVKNQTAGVATKEALVSAVLAEAKSADDNVASTA